MAEEESESVEAEIEGDPVPLADMLERINANLESIRTDLEKQNEVSLNQNVRLAVRIVLFAVPLSVMASIVSSYYSLEFLPLIGEGGWHSNVHSAVFLSLVLAFGLIVFKVFGPLMEFYDDPEVDDMIEKLSKERKKK